jgi:hypothetical protein
MFTNVTHSILYSWLPFREFVQINQPFGFYNSDDKEMASKLVILLLFAALQHSSQYPSPFSAFAPLYSLLNSKVDCADGVCDVKSQDRVRTSSSDSGSNENSSLNELVKMGWKEQEAKRALLDSKNDIETAAALLEREQEENEALEPLVQEIMNEGWGRDVSITALKQSQGNVTDALKMIEMEEKLIQEQFDKGVKDMVLIIVLFYGCCLIWFHLVR